MNRQISLPVVFFVLWSAIALCANVLFCALKLIVSNWFWRIYGPFVLPFMKVYANAARVSFEVTICGVRNVVFPSLYGNVKQDGRMKGHWWLVDSGAGRSMSSNIEDFIYLEPWTGGKVQVGEDFELIGWDFVSNPSTHGAFMVPMNESVNKQIQEQAVVCNEWCKAQDMMREIITELN